MSVLINEQMCAFVRTLFEHPSKWYASYQENGTKYLKSRKELDEQLQQQLNACAGEIFICGIPPNVQAEKIAEVASLVGEVYILRYKVHFSGASRGFAFLQYIDPNMLTLALEKLPNLFRMFHLPSIKVCSSRNSSKLLLRKASKMTPKMVLDTLNKLITFTKLVGNELAPGYFEYEIIFKCNEEAVHGRRELLKSILIFGPKAVIVWDAASRGFKTPMMKDIQNKNLNFLPQNNIRDNVSPLQPLQNHFHQNFLLPNKNNFINDFRYIKQF